MGSISDHYAQELVMMVLDMNEDQLNTVSKAIRLRRSQMKEAQALQNEMELYVGDTVKLSANMSKKYLCNARGYVRELNPDNVKVELAKPYTNPRTYESTYNVIVGYDAVTKVW